MRVVVWVLACRRIHIVTMNFTVPVNSTGEELFTTVLQTFSESSSSSGDDKYSSHAGGLWTTETMAVLTPIVTDSLWEQAITAGLLILFWVYVNVSNGTFFYVIQNDYSLHAPQYMVLVSYMICDTFFCNITLIHMVPVVVSNDIQVMGDTVSRILVTAYVSCMFALFHLVGLLAYERYCYFITPLKYPRKFTKPRIFTAVIIIYLFALSIALAVDLIEPRIPVATILTYQTTGLANKITNIIYTTIYIIPSSTVSVVTLIKLRLLISKHKAQVHPTQSDVMNEDQSAVSGILVKPVRKALKMVGLVSGSFWMTMIPGVLIRLALSASGVTWSDTDQRISLPIFALSRASYMLITILSSAMNPIIYMSVLTELREAVWKCIGIKRNNLVSQS